MLIKEQITKSKKNPMWIIVIFVVFSILSLIFELKSDHSQETAKLVLKIASKVEEANRRRDQNIYWAFTTNFKVSSNCKQDIYFPFENSVSKTTKFYSSKV